MMVDAHLARVEHAVAIEGLGSKARRPWQFLPNSFPPPIVHARQIPALDTAVAAAE